MRASVRLHSKLSLMPKAMRLVLFSCIFLVAGNLLAVHPAPSTTTSMSTLTVGDVVDMEVKDLKHYLGRKITIKERLAFGLYKRQLKKGLKKGKLTRHDPAEEAEKSFRFVPFLIGLFLGLIGLVAVVIFYKDQNAWRSALYGVAILLLLATVIAIATLLSLGNE